MQRLGGSRLNISFGIPTDDEELAKGWGQVVTPLPIETAGGEQRVGNTDNIRKLKLK